MKSSRLISIVVPIYNVEKYIHQCLTAIERQSFADYEVILVNDGSTDASGEIARQYAKKYEHWIIVDKENGGLSSARNAGIERAQGEYICFMDSDDFVTDDYLQKLYDAAMRYEADLVFADFHEVDEAGHVIEQEKEQMRYEVGLVEQEPLLMALTNVGAGHYPMTVVVAWNKLIRTDIMKQFRYKEGVLHEDEFLIMPLLLACQRVAWIADDIYAYRQRENSIMTDAKLAMRHLQVLDAFYERIELTRPLGYPEVYRMMRMCYFWDIEVWYYFMRTKYKVPWYKLYGFFTKRMRSVLRQNYNVLGKRKKLEYLVFSIAPEIHLKYIYK